MSQTFFPSVIPNILRRTQIRCLRLFLRLLAAVRLRKVALICACPTNVRHNHRKYLQIIRVINFVQLFISFLNKSCPESVTLVRVVNLPGRLCGGALLPSAVFRWNCLST